MKIVLYIIVRHFFSFCSILFYTHKLLFLIFWEIFVLFTNILLLFFFFFFFSLLQAYLVDKSLVIFIIGFTRKCCKSFMHFKISTLSLYICIIHKISVLFKITWITLKIVFLNDFQGFSQVLRIWKGRFFKIWWWGELKSIHGRSMGGLKCCQKILWRSSFDSKVGGYKPASLQIY